MPLLQFNRLAIAALLLFAAAVPFAPSALAACSPGTAPAAGGCSPGAPPGTPCCRKCAAQHFSDDGTSCKSCPKGSYATDPGSTSCITCPSGSVVNTAKNGCFACASYLVMNAAHTDCSACPTGQFPNAGQTACVPCPAGTHFELGSCQPNPTAVPNHPAVLPNLLDNSNPGLGPQGPAGTGAPAGRTKPGGAGVR